MLEEENIIFTPNIRHKYNRAGRKEKQVSDAEKKSESPAVEKKAEQKEIFRTKRSYIPVEIDKREKLIRAVEDQGLTIKEAAQNLKINYSTAKHIVKVYKRAGEL